MIAIQMKKKRKMKNLVVKARARNPRAKTIIRREELMD
jgi:hypothetical protein